MLAKLPRGGSRVESDRRRTPRYSFIASAELVDANSDVRIASRVSELSLHGCYLDMMNPFPVGTPVLVKILAGQDFFQSRAKIVYSQANLGAGLEFIDLEPQYAETLDRWLDDAGNKDQRIPE
jgi:hypothetical protein